MPELYELNPVTQITVGALGQPGQRIFFLQASQGDQELNLKMEKQQVHALAKGIDSLLQQLEEQEVHQTSSIEEPAVADTLAADPAQLDFVAGQIGLGFDQSTGLIVLVIEETSVEEDSPPVMARLWASLGQMRALSRRAKEIVAAGRPNCPLCGRPMDPDGHFCPGGNGHSKRIPED